MDKAQKNNTANKYRWRLNDKQYIEISNRNRVAFRCQSSNPKAYRGVSLTPFAFECLCKYIALGNQNNKKAVCLDKNIWLRYCCGDIFLSSQLFSNNAMGQFFQFKPNMWKQYVDEYHKDVHNALKEILYRKAISKDRKNKTKTGLKSKIKIIKNVITNSQ